MLKFCLSVSSQSAIPNPVSRLDICSRSESAVNVSPAVFRKNIPKHPTPNETYIEITFGIAHSNFFWNSILKELLK